MATIGVFILAVAAPGLVKATSANFDELIKSLLFVPFAKENGLVQPTLFVGWTLNYEMMFYALFAAALFLRRAIGDSCGGGRSRGALGVEDHLTDIHPAWRCHILDLPDPPLRGPGNAEGHQRDSHRADGRVLLPHRVARPRGGGGRRRLQNY